ncbi:MAG: hypothetical protein KF764_07445 [Labilithrix sp.]|nr:hypothetical protein [Labilithrix sp.]MBX3220270.1 hypothetical protein [Labilithrix sp.]
MTGKAKIEGLTNSWYGFAVFSAVCAVLMNGIGVFSIATAIAGMLFSWFITFLIGRALIKKSSLTRFLLLFVTGLFTVLGTLGVGKAAWMFVQTWQLGVLAGVAYGAVSTWMYARSLRTLMDGSVKAYIG